VARLLASRGMRAVVNGLDVGARASAVEWSDGYTLGSSIGIKGFNLKADYSSTAHAGYDTNALMYFHFAHRSPTVRHAFAGSGRQSG
jgi:hypothetical protein